MGNTKFLRKNFLNANGGITLVALVVTIIVLLILAAVSLSLVAGSDGLLNRASNAVDKTTEAEIVEEIELAMAQLKADYYYERYISNPTGTGSFVSYLTEKLEDGVPTAHGTLTFKENDDTKVIFTNTRTGVETEGTFDDETGIITILGRTVGTGDSSNSGGSNTPVASGTPVLEAITDSTHYGDYFELGTNLIDKENVKLENDEKMFADWRIFSRDDHGIWLILADYLPVNESEMNSFITGTDTNQVGLVTLTGNNLEEYKYTVFSIDSTLDLVSRLNGTNESFNSSNPWKQLLPNSLQNKDGVEVFGAFSLTQWVASWNSLYDETEQIELYEDEAGRFSWSVWLKESDGYYNTLYFPHRSWVSHCLGYWFSSVHEYGSPVCLDCSGYFLNTSYNYYYADMTPSTAGVRPVVYLPYSMKVEQNEDTKVWRLCE